MKTNINNICVAILFCLLIAICTIDDNIYATDTLYKTEESKEIIPTSSVNAPKSSKSFNEELLIFATENFNESNINKLTTNVVSKEDVELCGLKGTLQINEYLYYITYTSQDEFIVNKVSLMEELKETKYAITTINIFSNLDENSNIIATYNHNDEISIIGQYQDWYKVSYGEQTGYIKNINVSNSSLYFKRENGKTLIYNMDGERVGTNLTSISLGTFKCTSYCDCKKCCGKWSGMGITASGAKVIEGTTIAVDPKLIPYGTCVSIDGHTYIAQDTGGAIKNKRIDVYKNSHEEALIFGVKYKNVIIYVN